MDGHASARGSANVNVQRRVQLLQNVSIKGIAATQAESNVSGLFVALLLVSLCLTRPSIFGQELSLLGGLGIVVTTLAFLITRTGPFLVTKASPERRTAVALLVFWCYVFAMSALYGSSNLSYLLKATAGGLSVPICFLLLSVNGNLVNQTFSALARVNAVLGYSIAITICLLPILGYAGLRLATYAIGGYDESDTGNGDILIPFTVVYGVMKDYGIYRFCGIYREAGIAQAFFVWSFVYLAYSRARWYWMLGALFGALLCGATAVIISLAAAALVHFGSRAPQRPRELILLLAMLTVMVLLLLFVPGIGLIDKAATHGSSITDREEAMSLALPGADSLRWLFGHGLFYESTESVEYAGVNAISAIFGIGVVGFVLYLWTFFAGVFASRSYVDGCRYLTLIAPFIVTSLFFQPVVDAPLVMAVLFFRAPPSSKGATGARA
jgi:hypothetical protein